MLSFITAETTLLQVPLLRVVRERCAKVQNHYLKKFVFILVCTFCTNVFSQELKVAEPDPTQTILLHSEIDKINEKLKSDPENGELYEKRAMLFFALKDYENAVVDYSTLIDTNKEINAEHYFFRGLAKQISRKTYPISFCDDLKTAKLNGYKNENWEIFENICGF